MESLKSEMVRCFDTSNPYEVFDLQSDFEDERLLQRAYRKKALLVHPDRFAHAEQEKKDEATQKFQCLSRVYEVLRDADLRSLYDESGDVDVCADRFLSGLKADEDVDWDAYWRAIFAKLQKGDVEKFCKEYKESEEELFEVWSAYLEGEGEMQFILDNVMCATIEDESRFAKRIQEWIDEEELPDFPAFSKESARRKRKRRRQAEEEAQEAEIHAQQLGLNDSSETSLKSLIAKRQENRLKESEDFLQQLAAKYGSGNNKKSKKNGASKAKRGKKGMKKT